MGNEGRNTTCPSKNVDWDSKGQFWLPRLEVWDKLELARSLAYTMFPEGKKLKLRCFREGSWLTKVTQTLLEMF